jgi:hypothetical protein
MEEVVRSKSIRTSALSRGESMKEAWQGSVLWGLPAVFLFPFGLGQMCSAQHYGFHLH